MKKLFYIVLAIAMVANVQAAYTNTTLNISAGGGTLVSDRYISIGSFSPLAGQSSQSASFNNQSGFIIPSDQPILLFYQLTVIGGTGGGTTYTNQQKVTISADNAPAGEIFFRWTGDTQHVADATSATTTVTMPATAVSLTAEYRSLLYALTVSGGSGGGAYEYQQQISVTASPAPEGRIFDRWTGDTQYVADATSATTTVTMPATAVSLAAEYRVVVYTLTVSGGSSGGSYEYQQQVSITADPAPEGQVFDRWMGATQYVTSVTSAVTTVTMPAANVTLTANYAPIIPVTPTEDFTYTTNNNSITVTGYIGTNPVVFIPDTISGLPVERIGDSAFASITNLTHVTIPDSVKHIGNSAFNRCSGLVDVTLGNGVVGIGNQAFFSCSGLLRITIPDSVISIGDNAIQHCTSLTNITLGTGVNSIGFYAFNNTPSLTSITVDVVNPYYSSEEGVLFDKFKTELIKYPSGKAESVFTLPSSVTRIFVASALQYCPHLTSILADENNASFTSIDGVLFNKNGTSIIRYPGGRAGSYSLSSIVTSIGDNAFFGCSGITDIAIPASVQAVGDWAFRECVSLQSITFPEGVPNVGFGTLYGCSNLTNAVIPSSVTVIENWGFYGCSQLTCLTIPGSVTRLMDNAFRSCSGLTALYFQGNSPAIGLNVFLGTDHATVYYFANTAGWGATYGGLHAIAQYACAVTDGTGTGHYTNGASVAIAADAPASGYQFSHWTSDPAQYTNILGNVFAASTTFTMPATNISITATYRNMNTYVLTISGGTGGGFYAAGESVEITADTPPPGRTFDRWTGDTAQVTDVNAATTTIVMPAGPVSLSAEYRAILYTLTASASEKGRIEPSGEIQIEHGATQIFTAVPDVGYQVKHWLVGSDVVAEGQSTLSVIAEGDRTVSVVFEAGVPLSSWLVFEGRSQRQRLDETGGKRGEPVVLKETLSTLLIVNRDRFGETNAVLVSWGKSGEPSAVPVAVSMDDSYLVSAKVDKAGLPVAERNLWSLSIRDDGGKSLLIGTFDGAYRYDKSGVLTRVQQRASLNGAGLSPEDPSFSAGLLRLNQTAGDALNKQDGEFDEMAVALRTQIKKFPAGVSAGTLSGLLQSAAGE